MFEVIRQFEIRRNGRRTIFVRCWILEMEKYFVLAEWFRRFSFVVRLLMKLIETAVHIAEFGFVWLQEIVKVGIFRWTETIVQIEVMVWWYGRCRLFDIPYPRCFWRWIETKTVATTSLIEIRTANLHFWSVVAADFTTQTFQQTAWRHRRSTNDFNKWCTVAKFNALTRWFGCVEIWCEPSNVEIRSGCISWGRTLFAIVMVSPLNSWSNVIDCKNFDCQRFQFWIACNKNRDVKSLVLLRHLRQPRFQISWISNYSHWSLLKSHYFYLTLLRMHGIKLSFKESITTVRSWK